MKALLVLAFALISMNAFAGLDQLPVNDNGRMMYGEGKHEGNFNWIGRGRVAIYCHGEFFADEDEINEDWTAFVGKKKSGFVNYLQFSNDAGSPSCAAAKAIVACATENDLAYCEENVEVRRNY